MSSELGHTLGTSPRPSFPWYFDTLYFFLSATIGLSWPAKTGTDFVFASKMRIAYDKVKNIGSLLT